MLSGSGNNAHEGDGKRVREPQVSEKSSGG